jgi:hypothetical protein
MAIIRIKRSSSSGAPTSLLPGELAYSSLDGNLSNGGDRLYIGAGDSDGATSNIDVVGGKYFTDLLDHATGTLTASSAILVDANKKIDQLIVDNIDLNGNTISTTSGDLVLAPTSDIDANNNVIKNVGAPSNTSDAATKGYVDTIIGGDAIQLTFLTDSAVQGEVTLADSDLIFTGGEGIATSFSNTTVTFNLTATGVSAGTYGSSTAIPVFTVDKFGRIDSAGTAAISTTLTVTGDGAQTTDVALGTDTLTFAGGTGLTSAVTTDTVTFSLDSTNVEAGVYGSSSEIPVFTVDAQGRIDSAGTVPIATTLSISDDQGVPNTDTVELLQDTLVFAAGGPTGSLTATVSNNQIAYTVATATTSQEGVAKFSSDDFTVTAGNVTIKNGGITNTQLVNSSVTINDKSVSLGDSATLFTDDISEDDSPTNLWFTNARARSAISVVDNGGDGSLSYNSGTGEITYNGPSAAEVRTHFSGGLGVNYDSATGIISLPQAIDSSADLVVGTLETTGNLVVGGNLQVNGTTTTVDTENLKVTDNMIYLNAGESAGSPTASIDIGIAGNYNDDGSYRHAGFFRDATDNVWKVFDNYLPEPDASVQIDTSDSTFALAPFAAAAISGTTLSGKYLGIDSDFGDKTTDALIEGATNKYYTDERVYDAIAGMISNGSQTNITVTSTDLTDDLTFSVATATTSVLGVASFSTHDFIVAAGAVTIKAGGVTNSQLENSSITIGGTTVSLGETITNLSGITDLTVDNLNLNGNSLTSTSNGNILITPDGTGKTVISNLYIESSGSAAQIDEFIEDKVFNMFSNDGDAIDLTYNDAGGTISISAQIASVATVGVAQFDSDNFDVSVGGLVTIDTVDGGTY